jgi:hypothetical protein
MIFSFHLYLCMAMGQSLRPNCHICWSSDSAPDVCSHSPKAIHQHIWVCKKRSSTSIYTSLQSSFSYWNPHFYWIFIDFPWFSYWNNLFFQRSPCCVSAGADADPPTAPHYISSSGNNQLTAWHLESSIVITTKFYAKVTWLDIAWYKSL